MHSHEKIGFQKGHILLLTSTTSAGNVKIIYISKFRTLSPNFFLLPPFIWQLFLHEHKPIIFALMTFSSSKYWFQDISEHGHLTSGHSAAVQLTQKTFHPEDTSLHRHFTPRLKASDHAHLENL